MAGPDVARPFVEAAASTHPSLIDDSHYMDARFGVTNIPQVMWIDETGTVVRPPEPASPMPVGEAALHMVQLVGRMEEREHYVAMVKDWVDKGADSRYALSAGEVILRSPARTPAISEAAAHFELAQHLWRPGGVLRAGHHPFQRRPRTAAGEYHLQAPGLLGAGRLPLRGRRLRRLDPLSAGPGGR